MTVTDPVIDDLGRPWPTASNGAEWELISDRVMGGRSGGRVSRGRIDEREAIRLQGDVSLANGGGFLQIALDLRADGASVDASAWTGIEIDVIGNGETYNLHLRSAQVIRPWQSYRHRFVAEPDWRTRRLPFSGFTPHRIAVPLNLTALRRLGVVAIGRAFEADVALGGVRFYR